MLLNLLKKTGLLLMLASLFACDANINEHYRSGTADNAEIEEPLTEPVAQYQPQLTLANQFIDAFRAEQYQLIYDNYLGAEAQTAAFVDKTAEVHAKLIAEHSEIASYLPNQWYFQRYRFQGRLFLACHKILRHENGDKTYLSVFFDGEKPDKIIGFSYRQIE